METSPERAALERLLQPRQGTVTCRVDETLTVSLHGEPCRWRGTSVESAARHSGAMDLADERARLTDKAPRGRALRHGHRFVSAADAADRAEVGAYIGTVRAARLIARESDK